jgi:hypothetical protein
MKLCEKKKSETINCEHGGVLKALSIADRDDGPVIHLYADGVDDAMATLDADEAAAMFNALHDGREFRLPAEQDDVLLVAHFHDHYDNEGKPYLTELTVELEGSNGPLFRFGMLKNGREMSQLLGVLEHTFDPDYGLAVPTPN